MTIKSLKAKKIAILRIVIVARFYHKSAKIKCPQNKLYQRFLLVFSSQTKQSQQLLSAELCSIYDVAKRPFQNLSIGIISGKRFFHYRLTCRNLISFQHFHTRLI